MSPITPVTILAVLDARGPQTVLELAHAFGVDRRADLLRIRVALRTLRDDGVAWVVERVGRGVLRWSSSPGVGMVPPSRRARRAALRARPVLPAGIDTLILARTPATTRELAKALRVDEAALARRLQTLAGAGRIVAVEDEVDGGLARVWCGCERRDGGRKRNDGRAK